ncbi:MAG: hypothetical protein ABIA77_02375 [Candidatus Omnitrophota bacterium]
MRKGEARKKAQWEAEFYNKQWAVVKSHLTGFSTEPMNANVPEIEVVEVFMPSETRGG